MLKKFYTIALITSLVSLCSLRAETAGYTIRLDNNKPLKNLSQSYVGYDAEDFACGFNFNWMLNAGRKKFADYCHRAGVRCLRFAEMSRYSWRGEVPTRMMIAAVYGAKYSGNPQIAANARGRKLDWWFEPESFWSFCRENRIVVIPMINAESYYDAATKEAHYIVNKPEFYQKAAREAAAYLKWLKDKGYLDLAKAWEIGNECYLKGWNPEEYAAYVKVLISELRKVQPDIKLGIPTFICSPDNPDVKMIMKRISSAAPMSKSKEWQIYEKAMRWTAGVIKALGDDARYIAYGVQHSYGAGRSYNTNYKGIETNYKLLQALPGSRKWELINTEWRDRSGENLWCHRSFRNSALWKSKFVLLLMAYPHMRYTAAHSLFAFAGGLYWSNGSRWGLQFLPDRQPLYDRDNPDGKPRFDIGAFGPVVKMCNDLIDTHPLLLEHKAEMGKMSSAIYYESLTAGGAVKGDIDYIASMSESCDSLGLIIVNTNNHSVRVNISSSFGNVDTGSGQIEVLLCKGDLLDRLQIPGSGYYPWHIECYGQGGKKYIQVPANSIMKAVLPLKVSSAKIFEGINLIKRGKFDGQSKAVPAGFKGLSGAKLDIAANGALKVSNPGNAKVIYLTVPFGKVSDKNKQDFEISYECRAVPGKASKLKGSLLIAAPGWKKLGSKSFTADRNWQNVKASFAVAPGGKIMLIRINIYNLAKNSQLLFRNFKMNKLDNTK
jgi:hypothetical protein